jgi:nitroreductase
MFNILKMQYLFGQFVFLSLHYHKINEMIEKLLAHRTIRKYKDLPISDDLINRLLEAGCRASTTGNMQLYSIIVTKDETMKQKLLSCHFNQSFVLDAAVVLTFCADLNRFNKWCILRDADPCYDNFLSFFTASIDALLVAQNVALAAEEKGLGICYLGTAIYNADKIIQILNLPKAVVPITAFPIGYPDESPELTDRLPLEAVVHYEQYSEFSPGDIKILYGDKERMPFYQELLKINNKETLAQIFTDIRYTKKDNIAFSQSLLKVLKDQGFMNNE